MLCAALFDREVNCRRSAAAALQENLGRQGAEAFPLGLSLVALASDYFSLGSRRRAFLSLGPQVGLLDARVNRRLLDHLQARRVGHWDRAMRTLAAGAMQLLGMAELEEPADLEKEPADLDEPGEPRLRGVPAVLQRLRLAVSASLQADGSSAHPLVGGNGNGLARRHGSLLLCGQLLLCVGLHPAGRTALVADPLAADLAGLVPALEKARLYRGRGGEQIRRAGCLLVAAVARTRLPVNKKTLFALLDSLNENLR